MVANLAAGLYLASTGVAAWVVWLAGATTLLHGVLAWLEPSRERALAHVGYALTGGSLVMTAVGGDRAAVRGRLVERIGRPGRSGTDPTSSARPDLETPSAGVGLSAAIAGDGNVGRTSLYAGLGRARRALRGGLGGRLAGDVGAGSRRGRCRAVGALPRLAGASRGEPAETVRIWRPLGAALATIPFLIPAVGPRLLQSAGRRGNRKRPTAAERRTGAGRRAAVGGLFGVRTTASAGRDAILARGRAACAAPGLAAGIGWDRRSIRSAASSCACAPSSKGSTTWPGPFC